MLRIAYIALFGVLALGWAVAQQNSTPDNPPPKNQAPPRSDQTTDYPRSSEESSSKEHRVDISPPKDDAKKHPYSSTGDEDDSATDVQEFHPWDPHKAAKDVEVGDFYFKRKNYRAAEDRYRDALLYKPNDVFAMFGLGRTLEKLGEFDEARANYEGYLKILPQGPLAPEVRKALERLDKQEQSQNIAPQTKK
jgi:tetratricopeptide (TPR) repeat protein